MRMDDGTPGGNAPLPPLVGEVLRREQEPAGLTGIDAMLAQAIEMHMEWLGALEVAIGQAIVPEQLHRAGNANACGLGQLLDREDFQSRLQQHRFAEIFCEHMFFHEKAGQLVHVLATWGRTPEVDRLFEEIRQSSQKLLGSLNKARN